MTIINNPPTFANVPMAQITPFTYREGATLAYIIDRLKRWSVELGPEVEGIVNDALTDLKAEVEAAKGGWKELFDKFMADVVAQLAALNDMSVAQLVGDTESYTRKALDKVLYRVNVKSFGAKGDGATDDTAAFQAAVDFVGALGGGAVHVPAGNYLIRSWVQLLPGTHDNVWVEGDGNSSRIFKNKDQYGYIVFLALSKANTGYNGVKNFRLSNLRFTGDLPNKASCSALTGHHMNGVLVENCTFEQMSQNGHVFDLMGCKNVKIKSSTFAGCLPPAGREYTEAIQADCSARTGVGFTVDLAEQEVFDGSPCVDIYVENNRFVPLTVGSTTYLAQPPFGSHTYVDGMPHKRLHFTGNYVEDVVGTDGNSFSGVLHFIGSQEIVVKRNVFRAVAQRANGVFRAIGGANAILFADVNTPSVGLKPATTPINCSDFVFEGNSVEGFNGVAHLIWLYGVSGNRVANVKICRNKFKNCHQSDTMVLVRVTITDGLFVKDNDIENVGQFVYFGYCNDVAVERNDGTCVVDYVMDSEYSDRISVKGNNFKTVGKGIRFTGASHLKFHSNNLECVSVSHGVQVIGTTSVNSGLSIIGNTVINTSTEPAARTGIYCNATTYTKGAMGGNVIEGYTGATFSAETVEKFNNVLV